MSDNNGITTPTLRWDEMHPDERNVRQGEMHDIEDLAQSIYVNGVLSPLAINRATGTIVAGHRRHAAIGKLIDNQAVSKSYPIPVHYVDVTESPDGSTVQLMLVENLQREDLNPIEEARAFHTLTTEFELNQGEIGERIGKSGALVGTRLKLLRLPDEAQAMVATGELKLDVANELTAIANHPEVIAEILEHPSHYTPERVRTIVERVKLTEKVQRTVQWIVDAGSQAVSSYDELTQLNRRVDHESTAFKNPTKATLTKGVKKRMIYWVRSNYDGSVLVQSTAEMAATEAAAESSPNKEDRDERDKKLKLAAKERNAAIAELVNTTTFKQSVVTKIMSGFIMEECSEQSYRKASRYLGLNDLPQKKDYENKDMDDHVQGVQDVILGSSVTQANRALMALMLARFDGRHTANFPPRPEAAITVVLAQFDIGLTKDGAPRPVKTSIDMDNEGESDD